MPSAVAPGRAQGQGSAREQHRRVPPRSALPCWGRGAQRGAPESCGCLRRAGRCALVGDVIVAVPSLLLLLLRAGSEPSAAVSTPLLPHGQRRGSELLKATGVC